MWTVLQGNACALIYSLVLWALSESPWADEQGKSSNNPRPRCQDLASTRHWAMYHLLMITGYLLHSITHKFQRRNSLSLWRQFRATLCRDDALHANWDDSDPLGSLPGRNRSTLRSCCCLQHVPAFPGSSHLPPCSCSIQESQGFLKSKANPTTSLCDGPLSCRPTLPHTTSLGHFPWHFPHIWVVLYFFHLLMFIYSNVLIPRLPIPFLQNPLSCSETPGVSCSVCPTQLPLCFTDWAKHMTRMDPSTWPSYPCFRRGGVRSGWDGHRLLSLFQTRTQAQWNPLFKV